MSFGRRMLHLDLCPLARSKTSSLTRRDTRSAFTEETTQMISSSCSVSGTGNRWLARCGASRGTPGAAASTVGACGPMSNGFTVEGDF